MVYSCYDCIWANSYYGTFCPPLIYSSNTHAQPTNGAGCLIFGRTLHLLPYCMCANSEGSGETAQMRRLAWAFGGRLCDKYHNLMSWLILSVKSMLMVMCNKPLPLSFFISDKGVAMTSSPGTASPELSDDERLLDLVRLIATRHPSALSTVQNAIEDAPYLAITTLSFLYRETCARNEHECSCHYENEYLTYITETGFDFEKFNHVARNVIRGVCRHARNDQNGLGLSSADSEISLLSLMSDKENNNAFQFNRQRRPISLSLSYETDNIVENKHRKLRQQNSDSSAVSVELDENRENRVHFKISPHGSLSSLAESQDSPSTPTRPKNFSPVSRQSSTGSHQSSVSEFEDDFRQSRLFKRRSSANFANPSLGRRRSSALRLMDVELDFIKLRTETSLLHVAAAVGDGSLLSFLMKTANASLLQIGAFQLSPLHLAILKKKMCYIKQIILNPDIRLAGSSGTFKFASRPVDKHGHKRHLESSKLSLIGLCVKMEDTETLRDLLNLGMFGDIALERGLKEAVENDSFAVVELLLQTGIRPSLDILKEGSSKSVDVFDCLFRRFRKDFKIYCLQHPDIVIRDLLMPSILIKNADVVRILVQNGIPLKQTKGFYSPVTCAVLDNQPEILTILLQNNADKSAEMQGYSLLDIACCMGFNECTGLKDEMVEIIVNGSNICFYLFLKFCSTQWCGLIPWKLELDIWSNTLYFKLAHIKYLKKEEK